jgi:hypothetical protein
MYRPRTRDAGDRHGRRSAATCAPRARSLPPVRRTAFRLQGGRDASQTDTGRPASLFFRCIFSGPALNGVRAPTLAPRLLQFLTFLPWPCSRFGRRFRRPCITEHAHADERPADFL